MTIVETSFGTVEGFEYATEKGITTRVFLGIRYGKEPERFKKPEMVDKWVPSVYSAKEFGPAAYPYTESFLPVHKDVYSEDCLFLNIIAPPRSDKPLPVFVFIHGGGYCVGTSSSYGYKRLSERVASEGIVVVTISYRLGPLGFFSLGDSAAPGNMGLWDQTLALKFLTEILPSFGGDISRITVGGHSAGSGSASALQYSPHSNSLYSQSILMSGSILSEFFFSEMVVEQSRNLAKELGCLRENTEETLQAMQELPVIDILRAVDRLGPHRRHPNGIIYQPRFDGDFFPAPIHELARTAPKKRTLSGTTDQESAIFIIMAISGLAIPKEEWPSYSREQLIELIETVVVTDAEHGGSAASFRRLLVEFYVEKDEQRDDSIFYLNRLSEMIGDLQFYIPLWNEAQLKVENDWPTYLYILQHHPKQAPRDTLPVKGNFHGDELNTFSDNLGFYPVMESDPEYDDFAANLVSGFVHFIKNGDPSSPTFSWPAATKEQPFRHASIAAKMSFKNEAYRTEAARFWLETIPRVVRTEVLRKTRLPGAGAHVVQQ